MSYYLSVYVMHKQNSRCLPLTSVQYPSAYAPPNHFDLPLSEAFGHRFPHSVITAHGPYPLYRETHLLIEDVKHFGRHLEFSRPLVTIAAKLLYFTRREMVPIGIPTHLPIDRDHAISLGHTHVRPTQADVHEVNNYHSVSTVEHGPWDYLARMSNEEQKQFKDGLWTPTLTSASAKWDNEWNRAAFCHDPWNSMPLKGVTYTHGMLNGLWQGRMLVSFRIAAIPRYFKKKKKSNAHRPGPHRGCVHGTCRDGSPSTRLWRGESPDHDCAVVHAAA